MNYLNNRRAQSVYSMRDCLRVGTKRGISTHKYTPQMGMSFIHKPFS